MSSNFDIPSVQATSPNATAVHIPTNKRLDVASYRECDSTSVYTSDGYSLRIKKADQQYNTIPGSSGDEFWFIVDGKSKKFELMHAPSGYKNKIVYLILVDK
jgi:hypothetical protein